MLPLLAIATVRTEARQVERTELRAHVFLRASRAQRAEALVVVRTRGQLGVWVDVQVKAFRAVGAVEISGVEVTFWHATSV